jgi:RNA polymerase sigma-70 factor (ECF subfamily)
LIVVDPVRAASAARLRSIPVSREGLAWERSLVDRIVAGDDSALVTAYDQYSPLVYGIAARMLGRDRAADVCQEVFVALWDHPERFDAERGTLRAYLVTVARRRCIDQLRLTGRRSSNELRAHVAQPVLSPNVDESALAMIAGQRVRRALDALPPEQRRAIELAYFDGLTFRQVAEATGASEGTAKSRIRLGLHRLADQMRQFEHVEPA